MHFISLVVCTVHASGRSVRLNDTPLSLQAVTVHKLPDFASPKGRLTAPCQLTVGGHPFDDSPVTELNDSESTNSECICARNFVCVGPLGQPHGHASFQGLLERVGK
jgi:hypothetical protein